MRVAHVVEAVIVTAGIATTSWWIVHSRRGTPAVPIETAVKPSPPDVADLQTGEGRLHDLRENYLVEAAARFRVAELAETPAERRRQLWREILALDEGFIGKATPLLDLPKYQAAEYEWLQRGVETAFMRVRMIRDRLRSPEPSAPPVK